MLPWIGSDCFPNYIAVTIVGASSARPRIGNAFFPNDNAADRKERFDGRAMHAPTNYTENS